MSFTVTAFAAPYSFDGAYARCYDDSLNAMDPRHVFIVHEILRGWPFQNALEIGCYRGASSTAFIEAINAGASPALASFCEIDIRDELIAVLNQAKDASRFRLTAQPSFEVLEAADDFDFVLVDARHDLQSVTPEIDRLILRRPLCVMAHDTNATAAGYRASEGAELLKQTFERERDYVCIEDCRRRRGERTERGLFCAVRQASLLNVVCRAFTKWNEAPL